MFSKLQNPQGTEKMARGGTSNGTAGAEGFSILAADIVIHGDIHSAADLHIDGRIEGDIACTALVQGERSEVIGAIRADSARLAGTVRGSIDAASLVILKTARIHGDVSYDALTIEQGARVEGRFAPRGVLANTSAIPLAAPASIGDESRISLLG